MTTLRKVPVLRKLVGPLPAGVLFVGDLASPHVWLLGAAVAVGAATAFEASMLLADRFGGAS